MFQNSVFYFTGSFQAALFSFADLRRNKGFLLAESPFFSSSWQKKKNRCFGTCKPAKLNKYKSKQGYLDPNHFRSNKII